MRHAYLLFWFFALIFIVMGLYMACSDIVFYTNATVVPGTVVRYEKQENSSKGTWYAAVFSFSIDGITQEAVSSLSSTSPENKNIGQEFKVAVNKKNIKEAKLLSDLIKEVFLFAPGLIVGGLIFFALAFFFSPYVQNRFMCSLAVGILVSSLFLIAIGIGGVGAWLLYSNKTFFKNAVMIQGTVVDFEEHESEDDDGGTTTMYAEVVAYTFNGVEGKIVSDTSSSIHDSNAIGQTRPVGVNPKNPYDARLYSKWNYVLAIGLMCLSALLLFAFFKAFISKAVPFMQGLSINRTL